MAVDLARLFGRLNGRGLRAQYGTVTSAAPLRVRPDSMELGDVGPLHAIRGAPALGDRVLLLLVPGSDNYVVVGTSAPAGDAVLIWGRSDNQLAWATRVGDVWSAVLTKPSLMSPSLVSATTQTDAGSGLAEPIAVGTSPGGGSTAFGALSQGQPFKMSDGALVVVHQKQQTFPSVDPTIYAWVRSPAGVWSAPVVVSWYLISDFIWDALAIVQNGNNIYAVDSRVYRFTSAPTIRMNKIAYNPATGLLTTSSSDVLALGDLASGLAGPRARMQDRTAYWDSDNGLVHVEICGDGAPGELHYPPSFLAISPTTMALAYSYPHGLGQAVVIDATAGGGGRSFVFGRDLSGSVGVYGVVASSTGYTITAEGTTGLTRMDRMNWDGATANLVAQISSSLVRVQRRTAPAVFGPISDIATTLRVSTPRLVAKVGPRARLIYHDGSASPMYDDEILVG